MRRIWIATPLALVVVLGATTACGSGPAAAPPADTATGVIGPGESASPGTETTEPEPGQGNSPAAPAAPRGAVALTLGLHQLRTGRAHHGLRGRRLGRQTESERNRAGLRGPSENVGQKLLALAKRYRQVCFIGRGNYRDDKEAYIFEYWRNPSGINSPIPDSEDDCSSYDRNNLQVNDMGSGYGWRVKDDDHVLQIFDTDVDAKNGKIVLAKYNQICEVDSETPDGTPADITYA